MKSTSKYAVERSDLDALIVAGGGTIQFDTSSEAIAWRNRVYRMRALMADESPDLHRHYSRALISIIPGETLATITLKRSYRIQTHEGTDISAPVDPAPAGPSRDAFARIAKGNES